MVRSDLDLASPDGAFGTNRAKGRGWADRRRRKPLPERMGRTRPSASRLGRLSEGAKNNSVFGGSFQRSTLPGWRRKSLVSGERGRLSYDHSLSWPELVDFAVVATPGRLSKIAAPPYGVDFHARAGQAIDEPPEGRGTPSDAWCRTPPHRELARRRRSPLIYRCVRRRPWLLQPGRGRPC